MAIFRLLWLWSNRHAVLTAESASKLRRLLMLQMGVFVFSMLMLGLVLVLPEESRAEKMGQAGHILGFGFGWVATIRYYVWRYVG